jgi:peptidyl-prolyl cis-trans isomerase C
MYRLFVLLLTGAMLIVSAGCSKDDAGEKEKADTESAAGLSGESGAAEWVAKVNNKVIDGTELEAEEGRVKGQLMGRMSPEQLESMAADIKKQALSNLVNRELVTEVVEKEGIKAPEEKIAARMKTIRDRYASEEEFQSKLAEGGMTAEKLRTDIETGLAFEMLFDKLFSDVKVGEEDITDYYNKNADSFKEPERVKASHILLKVDPSDTEEMKTEKREKLQSVLEEIRNGADFAEMAKTHSECPSAPKGGDLGFFERGRMVPDFEQAAFALNVGEMSDIVETDFGYHIIKVIDRTEARNVPLEEARERITNYLDGVKRQEAANEYLEKLRSEAVIEYADTSLAP